MKQLILFNKKVKKIVYHKLILIRTSSTKIIVRHGHVSCFPEVHSFTSKRTIRMESLKTPSWPLSSTESDLLVSPFYFGEPVYPSFFITFLLFVIFPNSRIYRLALTSSLNFLALSTPYAHK